MSSEAPDTRDVLAQLDRILASAGFARNERMSRFLRVLVERHLEGRDDELKESIVGAEVFGRRPDYDPKQDSIVRTEAGRLRARLAEYYAGPGADDPLVIELPKGGYVPAFRPVRSRSVASAPGLSRWSLWTISALSLAAVALGLTVTWRSPSVGEALPIPIAVLPLESLSVDPADGYFADGLTDELIRNLSAVEGLAVRSRTSVFTFQGRPRNIQEAAGQLQVDYVIEGAVLREGPRVRINASLVRAADDVPLWSGQFNRELGDVFAIQDEIARGIVNQLRLSLGRGRWRYETSVEAYDLYLRGETQFAWPATLDDSIGLFEQAIAIDPSFAPAYARLGEVYAIRSVQFALEHPAEELDRMRRTAARAVELDPLLADAHAALALSRARDGAWDEAEESFRRAVALAPSRSRTRLDYAMWLLAVVGRTDEAIEQLHAAAEADPLSPEVRQSMAWLLVSSGHFDEAVVECARMADGDPIKLTCEGRAAMGLGRLDEAIQYFEQDPMLDRNPQARGFLGYAYARAGRREEAIAMAERSVFPNEQALIYAGLEDSDRALDALLRMNVVGAQRVGRYLGFPEMATIRQDPRVDALRATLKLPPVPGAP